MIRVAVGIIAYLVGLGLVAVLTYALWAGPQWLGVTEPWPSVLYFIVPYVGTVLVGGGIIVGMRAGSGLVRRMS